MQITTVNKLSKKDINQIAKIHFDILDESVLNSFGIDFLKILYKRVIKSEKNIVILLKTRDEVDGFLVATTDGNEFYKDISLNCFWELFAKILKQAVSNPKLFIATVHWSLLKSKRSDYPATLQFVAILPKYQGSGLGTKMVSLLNKEFVKRGIDRYKVGTKVKNKKSNSFYKKLKFRLLYKDDVLGEYNNYYLSTPIQRSRPKTKDEK